MDKMLTVDEVMAILVERGVSPQAFWSCAAGGDRTPILVEDLDRLIEECEASE